MLLRILFFLLSFALPSLMLTCQIFEVNYNPSSAKSSLRIYDEVLNKENCTTSKKCKLEIRVKNKSLIQVNGNCEKGKSQIKTKLTEEQFLTKFLLLSSVQGISDSFYKPYNYTAKCLTNNCNSKMFHNLGRTFRNQACWAFKLELKDLKNVQKIKKKVICNKNQRCSVELVQKTRQQHILDGGCHQDNDNLCAKYGEDDELMSEMSKAIENKEVMTKLFCCYPKGKPCHNHLYVIRLSRFMNTNSITTTTANSRNSTLAKKKQTRAMRKTTEKINLRSTKQKLATVTNIVNKPKLCYLFTYDIVNLYTTSIKKKKCKGMCGITVKQSPTDQWLPILNGECISINNCDYSIKTTEALENLANKSEKLPTKLTPYCCQAFKCQRDYIKKMEKLFQVKTNTNKTITNSYAVTTTTTTVTVTKTTSTMYTSTRTTTTTSCSSSTATSTRTTTTTTISSSSSTTTSTRTTTTTSITSSTTTSTRTTTTTSITSSTTTSTRTTTTTSITSSTTTPTRTTTTSSIISSTTTSIRTTTTTSITSSTTTSTRTTTTTSIISSTTTSTRTTTTTSITSSTTTSTRTTTTTSIISSTTTSTRTTTTTTISSSSSTTTSTRTTTTTTTITSITSSTTTSIRTTTTPSITSSTTTSIRTTTTTTISSSSSTTTSTRTTTTTSIISSTTTSTRTTTTTSSTSSTTTSTRTATTTSSTSSTTTSARTTTTISSTSSTTTSARTTTKTSITSSTISATISSTTTTTANMTAMMPTTGISTTRMPTMLTTMELTRSSTKETTAAATATNIKIFLIYTMSSTTATTDTNLLTTNSAASMLYSSNAEIATSTKTIRCSHAYLTDMLTNEANSQCMTESKLRSLHGQASISALHIAASSMDCQQQSSISSNVNAVRDTFRAAAKAPLKTEDDLLKLIDGSEKLLRASNSTDSEILSENVNIWEKIDQTMTQENMGNTEDTMAKIFEYAVLTNEDMHKWDQEENRVEAEDVDIAIEKKEYFAEHANNVLERLTSKLIAKKTMKKTEIITPGGYFSLTPFNLSNYQDYPASLSNSRVQIPPICSSDSVICQNRQEIAYLKIVSFESNLYDFVQPNKDLSGGLFNVSMIMATIGADFYEEVEITSIPQPIIIRFPVRNSNLPNETFLAPVMKDGQMMVYHEVTCDPTQSNLRLVLTKSDPNSFLVLYLHQNKLPWPTDFLDMIEFPAGQESLIWIVNMSLAQNKNYILGIVEVRPSEPTRKFAGYNFLNHFSTNYSIRFQSASCVFLEFDPFLQQLIWSSRGCEISEETTESEIVCLCDHLSTFAAGIIIAPNTIDFDYVISNMSVAQNPSIYATLLFFFLLFTLLMIVGFRKDRVISCICYPLPDNSINDGYLYKISVKTGLNNAASTDSVIRFILFGRDGSTEVRRFPSSKKVFRRGHTNYFLMRTKRSLGELECCKIWHDNTGRGKFASWFLQSIVVYDIHQGIFYHFFCNQWLSTNHEPLTIEKLLIVTDVTLVKNVALAFETNFSKKFLDDHLWLSIVCLPKTSLFTRCQRIICCFCIILTSMMVSSMFYDGNSQSSGVHLGLFAMGWHEVYIGFVTSLIVFPLNFLVVQMFKKSAPKSNNRSTQESMWFYAGWFTSAFIIVLSSVFILFYAIQMGDASTRQWLSSIYMSIIASIFFTQPLKVILFAIALAVIFKKIEVDNEETAMRRMPTSTTFLEERTPNFQNVTKPHEQKQVQQTVCSFNSQGTYDAFDTGTILVQILGLYSLFYELSMSLTVIVVVLILIYGNRDQSGYMLQRHVTEMLTVRLRQEGQYNDLPRLKIANESDFWNWTIEVLVPVLGGQSSLKKGLMKDNVNKVVGYAMLRQVRVKKESCTIQKQVKHLFNDCVDFINILNLDTDVYGPGWSNDVSKLRPEYHFVSPKQLSTLPKEGQFGIYDGGGYVLLLRKWVRKVKQQFRTLQIEKWVDYQTRAIIIEFSIYNVQVNLFCVGHILVETPPTGGFVPSADFRIVQLFKQGDIMEVCREVVYVITVLILMWVVVSGLMNVGCRVFFTSLNNILDFLVVFFSFLIFGVYYARSHETDRVMEIVNETEGKAFVDMAYAAMLEQSYNYLLGFVAFIATIKLVRLLRINRRVSLMIDILIHSSKGIIGFGFLALIIMGAYSFLFYFLFGSHLGQLNTIFRCLQRCFGFFLYRVKFFSPVLEVKPILGPLVVTTYFIVAILLIDNIFVTTLNTMIEIVRQNNDEQNDDSEMMTYAKGKIFGYFNRTYQGKTNSDINRPEEDLLKLFETRGQDLQKLLNKQVSYDKKETVSRLSSRKVINSN